ncbi:hypothetical protein CBER1_11355 [Cercospora berteroae]|uniref:Ecp2 effector protein domain-containing protein n=1 Tax=Cercospora berteroae TaxID=357750 RepID=A0A2S6BZ11_9PEZI|nr:hypothetical protein CBER1_11355 [Cercospora berteroae]
MKLIKLCALMLATLTLSSALKVKVWSSDTHTGNATGLMQCVADMEETLKEQPKARRYYGYACGDAWIQWGDGQSTVSFKTNLWVFNKCKDEIYDAALHSKVWFQCMVKGGHGKRIVAYSPYGYRACYKKDRSDHSPCKMRWDKDDNF